MRNLLLSAFIIIITVIIAGCQPNQAIGQIYESPISENITTISVITPTFTATPVPTQTTSMQSTEQNLLSTTSELIQPTTLPEATTASTIQIQVSAPEPTLPATPAVGPTSSTATILSSTLQTTTCQDEAAFYADVTIPDDTLMKSGEAFTKSWQIRNTGTCTWDAGYSLVYASGDIMNGPLSSPISVIEPGEIAEVSVDLVAPARGGQHAGNWQFENSQGARFGVGAGGHDYIWVKIIVDWPVDNSNQNASDQPTTTDTTSSTSTSENCSITRNRDYESQVLSLINDARTSNGLPGLTLSEQLSNAAYEHSHDMACIDFVDHTGSNGSTWYDRARSHGYANYASARENIYVGDPTFGGTPDGAYSWWMNSQVHRNNILAHNVSEVGIGYAYDPNSSYGGYYTVVFARP